MAGNPHGARGTCAGAGTTCVGQCTAASATACSYPGGESICRSATCTNGAASASQTTRSRLRRRRRRAARASPPRVASTCARRAASAPPPARATSIARPGYICQGGACQAKGAAAAPCTATSQCAGGLTCKDGVCCESACADPCRRCNLAGQAGHCVVVASADDPDSCPADTRTCNAGGACTLRDQQACTAAADCAGGACTTFYPDADGDSFGDRGATVANGKAKQICGAAGAGWVTSNSDCCDAGDTDKAVHPGQSRLVHDARPVRHPVRL